MSALVCLTSQGYLLRLNGTAVVLYPPNHRGFCEACAAARAAILGYPRHDPNALKV